ncbi:MAG: hypothetical protein QMC95_14130 [Desulfitobacteriaceae bacterium]|nr:hypothetical protein [Desulfitobacteriaceae bacterium]MDI6879783.1 hypothetical protein [Desulfitobacteriaceae bacterium]MDI6915332.1 hypothetical protein [Desulfitobacteriaceae bacterium]
MRRHSLQDWAILIDKLRPLGYAVAGGLAVGVYSPERATQDLDLVMVARSQMEERLHELGYTQVNKLTIGGSTWRLPDGREIDVIDISDRPWAEKALQEALTTTFHGFPILPLPYLVLMKLEASRIQDIADIGKMLKYADSDLRQHVRSFVTSYKPQDLEDYDQIVLLSDLT